jgi:hypothetical protein
MAVQRDFKEFCELLNSHGVEFVIVGAHALAFHGAPRFTGDIDFLVRPTRENALRLLRVFEAFGFGGEGVQAEDILVPGRIFQMGVVPVRIDVITSISGVSWEEVSRGKVAGDYAGVPVHFIGRAEYIANKNAAGRKKDRADVEALQLRPSRRRSKRKD